MFKQIILPILGVAAFIALVGYFTKNPYTFSPTQKNVTINGKMIEVSVAGTADQRTKGLGGVTSLDANHGMLFVFPSNEVNPRFWMKDMLIPLDIIWIDNGKIVKIDKNVPPPSKGIPDAKLAVFSSTKPVSHVLEVSAGFSDQNSIKVGDSVQVP